MAHKLNLVLKSEDEKIVRSEAQVTLSKTLGKQIRDLIQANLQELGAALCEGKPYTKGNGKVVVPYSVQGTINMPSLTFDDGSGDKTTHDWFINFRATVPVDGEKAPIETVAAPVRAMTIAERRAQIAAAHK